ncbi:carbamate kinase [Isachenkonia alkalipeptolytica]|uniref:Carbamate kinase n=1 Tax=Isachenkonia alkalipeptolytica TaxID=2565777 RepID=A0AA43XMZ9_9CLOT|nr:carbamate kinase [Isachenkonia alkalipeptolytica]NBG89254.1 carbamate kinase [Isachenkonia alkalipeptolytica]
MTQDKKRIVIALGGNALQADSKDTTAKKQRETAKETAQPIVDLIEEGHEVILAHGNGPQVGQIIATYETAVEHDDSNQLMPFPECGAMSQGYIGYHLQQAVREEMVQRGVAKEIATVVTQVVVDENDPGFQNPTKPVGSFYSQEDAKKMEQELGFVMKEDAGRGYRRVVASPEPVDVVEAPVVSTLVDQGHVVITVGGGGIPVVDRGNGVLEGKPAVIDKDFASEKVAEILDADLLIILTAVEKVAINFGKPDQKELEQISVKEAYRYIEEGHFAPGSMLPKVKAALKFVESAPGRRTLITSLDKAKEGIAGKTGTTIG